MNVVCWQCSTPFEAPKEQVKRWAESGAPFDPTEWECGCTEAAQHGVQPNDAAAQNSDSGSVGRVIGWRESGLIENLQKESGNHGVD